MKDFPAYHLTSMENAEHFFEIGTEKRVKFNDILEKDGIPVWCRLQFFIENADETVLARYAERVREFHPEVSEEVVRDSSPYMDAEAITDAYVDISRKRGSVDMVGDEAIFIEDHQNAVIAAAVTAGKAELLAIAILALYSVEEEANEKRYRERCEREQASLSA
jgi:hypothetical protein